VQAVLDVLGACLLAQSLQVSGRGVDGGDVGLGEAVEQGEGARSGTGADVHDPARGRLEGQPCGDAGEVFAQDLRVQVEDLRLAVDLVGAVVSMVVVGGVQVCAGHALTLRRPCAWRTISCATSKKEL
jgi:hypothetical protein